jgi:hypothetical protein
MTAIVILIKNTYAKDITIFKECQHSRVELCSTKRLMFAQRICVRLMIVATFERLFWKRVLHERSRTDVCSVILLGAYSELKTAKLVKFGKRIIHLYMYIHTMYTYVPTYICPCTYFVGEKERERKRVKERKGAVFNLGFNFEGTCMYVEM